MLPKKQVIKDYWANYLIDVLGKFDSVMELNEADYCFACGCDHGRIQRAHILAKCEGGTDRVNNIHLLCVYCHHDSEYITGAKYFRWLRKRTMTGAFLSMFLAHGGCLDYAER